MSQVSPVEQKLFPTLCELRESFCQMLSGESFPELNFFSNIHRPTLSQRFEGSFFFGNLQNSHSVFVALSSIFYPEHSSHVGLSKVQSLLPQLRETTGLCMGPPFYPAAWKLLLVHKLGQPEGLLH